MSQFFQPNTEALDAAYAKDKREAAEAGEQRPFQLSTGITEIRILPPFNERGSWYREMKEYFFQNDGEWNRITSPSQFGQPDPVAELRQKLIESGGDANLELAKDLKENRVFLYNIIIKSAPPGVEFEPGRVYVLKTGVKVKRSLLNHDRDVQGGWHDITNPESGVTFRITKSGKGFATDYQVQTCPGRTRLEDDLLACGMGMIGPENLYNLDELFPVLPYDEIRMRLLGMNPITVASAPVQAQPPAFQPAPPAPQGQAGGAGVPPATPVPSLGSANPTPQAQPVLQTTVAPGQPVAAPQPQPVAQPVEQAPLPEIPAPPPVEQ